MTTTQRKNKVISTPTSTFNIDENKPKISKIKGSLIACRPWSLTISATSVLLGTVLAFKDTEQFDMAMFFITLIGAISLQCLGNVVNSYYDYKNGNDLKEVSADRTMFDLGLTESNIVNLIGYLLLQCGSCLFLVLYKIQNNYQLIFENLLPICFFGLLLNIFYTANPIGLKYIGLGDLTIFFCFGPLLVQSSYMLQTHFFNFEVCYYSIPLAMTIVAVLHVNNTRDIESDRKAGSKTIASIIGLNNCYYLFITLYLISYGSLLYFSYLENKYVMMMPVIVLPKVFSLINEFGKNEFSDAKTAQLSFFFGGLNVIGVLLSSGSS